MDGKKKRLLNDELSRRLVKVVKLHSYFTRLSGGDGEKKKLLCCVFQNSYSKYLTIYKKIQIYFSISLTKNL